MSIAKSNKLKIISVLLIAVLAYFIWDAYSQPSIKDLDGGFKEVAFARNDQNKGGIVRVYAVSVANPEKANYEECIKLFPVNDYNSRTLIYFFDASKPFPSTLEIDEPHYDTSAYTAIHIGKRIGSD